MSLGTAEQRVRDRLAEWRAVDYPSRLWKSDPTLWSSEPMPEIEDRLGWLDLPRSMHEHLADIDRFRKEIHKEKFSHAVLLGMGGSSLAPEVFQRTFGNRKGYPELVVLDSTHPAAVLTVENQIDLEHTLFIVSSKSGTTTETRSFFAYFWQRVQEKVGTPGRQFVAITDPGTPLEALATERGFRRVFSAPPDVGGRYSALSVFGIVPAAVIGVKVHQILDGAWAMMENTGPSVAAEENPALWLGATVGEMAAAGRDKLTIITSATLVAFPAWVEQLVAESTGKDGKGILPVVDEPLGAPEVYGSDRLFVHIATQGQASEDEDSLTRLERDGHPVVRIQIKDRILLGQEFLRWEIAVAAAGSAMGIHPFNQPDVQLAKELAKKKMATGGSGSASAWDDGIQTIRLGDSDATSTLESWLTSASAGDYIALHAYLSPSAETTAALQAFRISLRDRLRVATTLGYGPRFLHSTGQLHKGGANTGLFIQIVDAVSERVAVPETDFTFGDLIRAQAMGDAEALAARGRRIIRLDIGESGLGGLGVDGVSALRRAWLHGVENKMTGATRISTLFWDIGGVVLTNGWDAVTRRRVAERYGIDGDELQSRHQRVARQFETGQLAIDAYLKHTVFHRPRSFAVEAFMATMFEQSRENSATLDIARAAASSRRYLMAVINNESRRLNQYRIDTFNLRGVFDIFLSSCFVHTRKPEAEIYEIALELTQTPAAESVFIDDRAGNLEPAQELGMHTILYRDDTQLASALERFGVEVS